MRFLHATFKTFTLLGIVCIPVAPAFGESFRDAALTASGQLFLARSGSCRDLLPSCTQGSEGHSILALDIVLPGQPARRILVPSTQGPEAEGTPALVYEDVSNSLFLIWENKGQANTSSVNLIRFEENQWSPVVEISGDVHPLKGPPQVVLTRGEYHLGGTEETALTRHVRSILHVVWWEQGPGPEEVYYTPIILADGLYLGHNMVHNLTALDHSEAPQPPLTLPAELHRAATIQSGRDEHSVVIGFVNPVTQHFVAFELRVVAGELSNLADQMHAQMVEDGSVYQGGQVAQFAERIRSHVIEMGHRLHPTTLAALADDVRAAILREGPDQDGDVLFLSERIRSHVIEMGNRMMASGGLASAPLANATTLVIASRPDATQGGQQAGATHDVCVQMVDSRLAPEVGAGSVTFFLAPNGRRAITSWQGADGFYFRESLENGWTEARRIALDGTIDASRAEQILRQRVRER